MIPRSPSRSDWGENPPETPGIAWNWRGAVPRIQVLDPDAIHRPMASRQAIRMFRRRSRRSFKLAHRRDLHWARRQRRGIPHRGGPRWGWK